MITNYIVYNGAADVYLKGSLDVFTDYAEKAKKYNGIGLAKNAIHMIAAYYESRIIRSQPNTFSESVSFSYQMAKETNYEIQEYKLVPTGKVIKLDGSKS